MSKIYKAEYDDGHDHGTFEYWSDHRQGSKANLEDAKRKFIWNNGYKRYKQIRITRTWLVSN